MAFRPIDSDYLSNLNLEEYNPKTEEKGFIERAYDDVTGTVERYFNGAIDGINEMSRAQSAQDDLMVGGIGGTPASYDEFQQSNDYINDAQKTFVNETVKPVVLPAALLGGPAAMVAAPLIMEDAYNSYQEGGLGKVARDFTYGGAVDFASQDNLGEQFYEKPISTLASGAMAVVPPLLMGKGLYEGGKGLKKGIENKVDSIIDSQEINPYSANDATSIRETSPEISPLLQALEQAKRGKFDEAEATIPEQRFSDNTMISDLPAETAGRNISPLLQALEEGKRQKFDEQEGVINQQRFPDNSSTIEELPIGEQQRAISPLLQALEERKRQQFDNANQQSYFDYMKRQTEEQALQDQALQQQKNGIASQHLFNPADRIEVGAELPAKRPYNSGDGAILGENPQVGNIILPMQKTPIVEPVKKWQGNMSATELMDHKAQQNLKSQLQSAIKAKDFVTAAQVAENMGNHKLAEALKNTPTYKNNIVENPIERQKLIKDTKQNIESNKLTPAEREYLRQAYDNGWDINGIASQMEKQYNDLISEHVGYLKQDKSNGTFERKSMTPSEQSDRGYNFNPTVSTNPKWYKDFYSNFDRKPTVAEMREIAIDHLRNGFTDTLHGEIPASEQFRQIEGALNGVNTIRKKTASALETKGTTRGTSKDYRNIMPRQVEEKLGGYGGPQELREGGITYEIPNTRGKNNHISETSQTSQTARTRETAGDNIPNTKRIEWNHDGVGLSTKISTGETYSIIRNEKGKYNIYHRFQNGSEGAVNYKSFTDKQSAINFAEQQIKDHNWQYRLDNNLAEKVYRTKKSFPRNADELDFFSGYEDMKNGNGFSGTSDAYREGYETYRKERGLDGHKVYFGIDPTRGKFDNLSINDLVNKAFDKVATRIWEGEEKPHSKIVTESQPVLKGDVADFSLSKWDKIYQAGVDDKHALNKLGDYIPGGKEVYKQARVSNAKAFGKAQEMLYRKDAQSLDTILKPVNKDIEGFSQYLEAMHSADQYLADMPTRMSVEEIQRTIDNAPPEFVKAQKQIIQYNNKLLDTLVDGGVLSRESVKAMQAKWQNYVPFMRDFSDTQAVESFIKSRGFINVANPVKKLKGSERELINPIESIIKNTYVFTNIAERNKVGRSFAELAGNGDIVKLVEGESSQDPKLSQFAVWNNGKKQAYRTTPELYRSMASLDDEASGFIVKMLSIPASTLRAGATLTPDFMARNIIRDAAGSFINSKYGFIPVIDTFKGLSHALKKDDLYWEWQREGGGMATMVGLDRNYLKKSLNDFKAKKMREKLTTAINPMTYLEVLRTFSEFSEQATRLGVYGKARSKGINTLDAVIDSRESSLDFGRHGYMGKEMNRITAFLNASIQGTDKMVRVFKDPKTRYRAMTNTALAVTLPSVVTWYMGKDDERVQRLPAWQKDLFWIVPTKGSGPGWDGLVRIPKPFEVGILFGSGTERMLDYMNKKDPKAFKGFGDSVKGGFIPSLVPTAMIPLMEWWANKSYFTGHNIISQKDQKLPDKLQYDSNTSELAKFVGEKFNLSPKKIDNTIRGYTGGLGGKVTGAVDILTGKQKIDTAIPNLPVVGAFTATSYRNSQPIQDFYDAIKEREEKIAESKFNNKSPNYTVKTELKRLEQASEVMRELRKQAEKVENGSMSSSEKRKKIDDIQLKQTKIAETVLRRLH